MQSLIEQLRTLAMMQEGSSPYATIEFERALGVNIAIDFPALLAHLERTQAVVDAARELQAVLDEGFGHCPHCDGDHAADDQDEVICAKAAALDAASRILGAMK